MAPTIAGNKTRIHIVFSKRMHNNLVTNALLKQLERIILPPDNTEL